MVQSSNRFCANCGIALESQQRFCPNCGSAIEVTGGPTSRTAPEVTTSAVPLPGVGASPYDTPAVPTPFMPESGSSYTSPPPPGADSMGSIAPPPPPDPYPSYSQPSSGYPGANSPATGQPVPGGYPATGQPVPGDYNVPDFARPQPGKRRTGLLVGILVVVALLIGGVIVVPGLLHRGNSGSTGATSTPGSQAQSTSTDNTGSTGGTTSEDTPTASNSTQPKSVTFTNPLTFTYASVTISILSVQQATSFSDDSYYYSQGSSGILRLNVKEANDDPNASFSSYYPSESMAIAEPNGTVSKANSAQTDNSVDNGVVRQNWIDFSVPMSYDPSQLVLQVGSTGEEQIKVPLKEGADLSQYQPKSSDLNKSTNFGNMVWTITNATVSLSSAGDQAKKGQRYITLKLKVLNNGSDPAIQSPYDYLRLKSGDTVASITTSGDIPVSFDAGSTTQCTAQFVVPVSVDGTYTLQLLGKSGGYWPGPDQQANLSFTLK